MTLLADGRLHFDNQLNGGWSDTILQDIPQYSQYLQWVDEPRDDKDKDEAPEEEVQPRVYTEEEQIQFQADKVRLHAQRRTILVLDLDHTLVHCTRNKEYAGNSPSFTIGHEVWFFDFRPGLVQFLENLQDYFEVHLYTFATRPYAEHLINAIISLVPDPSQIRFRTLFTRNECLDKKRKSVSEMFPDNTMVLVVDDNKGAVWTEIDNLIKIPPYYHFGKKAKRSPNDQHLLTLGAFLRKYHEIFFEQGTCETKVILAKMRELAASMCPLDLVAIERERERRKEKHRDKQRKKEKERLKMEKEQQHLSLVAGQQYSHHMHPMQLPSGEVALALADGHQYPTHGRPGAVHPQYQYQFVPQGLAPSYRQQVAPAANPHGAPAGPPYAAPAAPPASQPQPQSQHTPPPLPAPASNGPITAPSTANVNSCVVRHDVPVRSPQGSPLTQAAPQPATQHAPSPTTPQAMSGPPSPGQPITVSTLACTDKTLPLNGWEPGTRPVATVPADEPSQAVS